MLVKECIYYLLKNSLTVKKKGVAVLKMAGVKVIKSKVAAKIAKLLTTTVQVNLCHLIPRNCHQIHCQPHFLAATLDFTTFLHWPF